jgi:prepilin-type N-terminal cleavage/methylation domain-containing protein
MYVQWLRRKSPPLDERGDTLIELLIALVIIALAVVPVLGLTFEMLSGAAENRSLATLNNLMKSFAETATSQIELSPTPAGTAFKNCSGTISYRLLSLPTPRVAAPAAAVTVFTTGFDSGVPLGTFTVTVGGDVATKTTRRSQAASGNEMGNMQLTFFVPESLPSGPQVITVKDVRNGQALTSSPSTELTVTPSATSSTVSTLARYTMGVRLIRYWNPGTSTETTPLTDCAPDGGLQLLTLHARAGNGVSDTLTFDLRNPARAHVSVAAPSVTVTATPVFAALPSSGTARLVFEAVVTAPAGYRKPTKPVTWSITEAGSTVNPCPAPSGPTPGSDNSSTYTCTITLTSSSATGPYAATATYPQVAATSTTPGTSSASWVGVATVYGPNGGGTVSLSPATVSAHTSGETFTFTYTVPPGGMNGGELAITVPSSPTTSKKWTIPQTSYPATPGYTTAKVGATAVTVVTSGDTIELTSLTLPGGAKVTLAYGAGGGTSGVTTPTKPGPYTFTVQQGSVPSGPLTTVSGPPLTVTVT